MVRNLRYFGGVASVINSRRSGIYRWLWLVLAPGFLKTAEFIMAKKSEKGGLDWPIGRTRPPAPGPEHRDPHLGFEAKLCGSYNPEAPLCSARSHGFVD